MKIRNLVKNLFTILGAIIVSLILCEIILRVAGISYPVFYTYDELRGFALRSNKEGWYRNEGEAYLRINSLGYRDIEHSIEKPLGTFRIAVLGDSFTEARQVALEDTFSSYLETKLNTCTALAGKKLEVLNFGIANYGTTQELLTLQHHVWPFNPDLVLLAFFTGNDIVNNSKALMNSPGSRWRNPLRPFHVLKNGELVLDNSFRGSGWHAFKERLLYEGIHYFRVLEVINRARQVLKNKQRNKSNVKETWITEAGLTPSVYSPPKTAAWKEAWLITEKLFSLINQKVKKQGAKFVLATLTNAAQVHPNPTVREKYKTALGVEDLFYPERRIRSMGEKYGFPVITMAERLQQVATQNGTFLHGFKNNVMGRGHWNENGHRFAGEILVKDICMKVLTPSR